MRWHYSHLAGVLAASIPSKLPIRLMLSFSAPLEEDQA